MEQEDKILDPREQDRLDALLKSARAFLYASSGFASLFVWVQVEGDAIGLGRILSPPLAVAVAALIILLAMAADRLYRLAYPWLRLDPRRPPFASVVAGADPGRWPRATLAFLVPIVAAAWAAALTLDLLLTQLTLVVAALLFAISPRVIEYHLSLLRQRAQQPRSETRFSGKLVCWITLTRSFAFMAAVLLLLLATPGSFNDRIGHAAVVAVAGFVTLLLVHLVVLVLAGPLDHLGARFGYATQQTLHPASRLIGKSVGDALAAYAITYDALEMVDRPRGKLLMVSFATRIDAEPVQIRLYLKYNAKRLFSVDRKWNQDAVRAAEVSSVECDYQATPSA